MAQIHGSCLCGNVKFKCDNSFSQFHLCHCTQCQKTTGSAHVSNLFTEPKNIEWLSGEGYVKRYDVPGKTISTAFCTGCGSPVPYVSPADKALIVPAGILDTEPSMQPQDNIFWCERASWYDEGLKSVKYDGFPE